MSTAAVHVPDKVVVEELDVSEVAAKDVGGSYHADQSIVLQDGEVMDVFLEEDPLRFVQQYVGSD